MYCWVRLRRLQFISNRKCCRRTIGKGLTYHLHVFVYSKHHVVQKRRNYLLLDEEISDSDAIISEDDSHEVQISISFWIMLHRKSFMAFGQRTLLLLVALSVRLLDNIRNKVSNFIVLLLTVLDSDGSILPRDTEAYFPINQWINDCRNQDNTTSASAPISNATVDSINIHVTEYLC